MINFSGEHLERFKDGSLSIIFKDGKKNGAAILKDNYGNIQLHMNYVNDKLDGELRHYYNSGALMSSMYYSQGIQHGPSIIYYESGIVQMEVTYDTGKYNGILILYDEFGDKISETPYINGLKHGKNLNYYSKSQGGKVAELSYIPEIFLNFFIILTKMIYK